MKLKLFIIALFFPVFMFGQSRAKKLGDEKFNEFKYAQAIEFYQFIIHRDSTDVHAIRNLAICYENINSFSSANSYYLLLTESANKLPEDFLLYANFLKKRGKYILALKEYREFIKINGADKKISDLIAQIEKKDKKPAKNLAAQLIPFKFNTESSEFSPFFFNDQLLFTSNRGHTKFSSKTYGWDNQFYLQLYSLNKTTGDVGIFSSSISSKYHEGTMSFTADNETMYFTRNNLSDGKINRNKDGVSNLEIFIAQKNNDKWNITNEFKYNSDDYSVGHPAISADGTVLYFVSDMPGGFGGTDIYYCQKKDSTWLSPVNMGPIVNTADNEMFPFVSNDSLLLFSSNGHLGLGGLDVFGFEISNKSDHLISYSYPLNTAYDDFSLVINKDNKAYFASNRPGGLGGDDIYELNVDVLNKVVIRFHDEVSGLRINPEIISINSVENLPLPDSNDEQVFLYSLKRQTNDRVLIEIEGYESIDTVLYSRFFDPIMDLNLKLKKRVDKDLLIAENKPTTLIDIFDSESGDSLDLDVFQILEPEIIDLKASLDDGSNPFNFEINKRYRLFIKKEGYQAIDTVFYTDDMGRGLESVKLLRLSDDSKQLEFLANEFDNIYFDFDSYALSNKSIFVIDHIVNYMLEHDQLLITLASRTDDRGSTIYNDDLAMKRAIAVQKIFSEKGVNIDRVLVLALGESDPYIRSSEQSLEQWYHENRSLDFKLGTVSIKSLSVSK